MSSFFVLASSMSFGSTSHKRSTRLISCALSGASGCDEVMSGAEDDAAEDVRVKEDEDGMTVANCPIEE